MDERTLVIFKPDLVRRNLIGKIITIFEEATLKVVAMKMIRPKREFIEKHYVATEEWLSGVGKKTVEGFKEYDLDPQKELGTLDPVRIGEIVRDWLIEYMTSGSVVALILEGNRAIANVRRLAGNTIPLFAAPGTIRGDFAIDSPDKACREKRPVYNLIHASGNLEEAHYEINLWFPDL